MAIMASGAMLYGLTSGPLLFEQYPEFVYGLITAFN